jgi:hypothetical protein
LVIEVPGSSRDEPRMEVKADRVRRIGIRELKK